MKISSISKVALALMLMATPAEMCGQSFLKKLGKGLEKVLSTPSSSSQNQKKPTATVQKSTTTTQQANKDIVKDPNKIFPGQKLKIPPLA